MTPDQFWSSTMRTIVREFVVADTRRKDEHDRDMRLAWHVAVLERRKKLPTLESLMAKRASSQQTRDAMGSVLAQLSAQYGIPLKHHPRPTGSIDGK